MAYPPEIAWPAAVAGLCVGSFLNVVIHRTPIGESPWSPSRSYCPKCAAPIRPYDNVPLVSYILLRARCRACDARISLRYPAVEVLTACIFGWAAWRWGLSVQSFRAVAFASVLVSLAVIDCRAYRLPDAVVGVGAAIGAAFAVLSAGIAGSIGPVWDALFASGAGLLLLGAVRMAASRIFGREAMGLGDVKLLGMIGMYLGDWRLVLLTVGVSAVVGTVVGTPLVLARGLRSTAVPYGPFLAIGAWISFAWGPRLADAYTRMLGLQ
jgi:leader peptidase (prepilin peptidase)/N-methyltransferase